MRHFFKLRQISVFFYLNLLFRTTVTLQVKLVHIYLPQAIDNDSQTIYSN
jgi:hypothetical protein